MDKTHNPLTMVNEDNIPMQQNGFKKDMEHNLDNVQFQEVDFFMAFFSRCCSWISRISLEMFSWSVWRRKNCNDLTASGSKSCSVTKTFFKKKISFVSSLPYLLTSKVFQARNKTWLDTEMEVLQKYMQWSWLTKSIVRSK